MRQKCLTEKIKLRHKIPFKNVVTSPGKVRVTQFLCFNLSNEEFTEFTKCIELVKQSLFRHCEAGHVLLIVDGCEV